MVVVREQLLKTLEVVMYDQNFKWFLKGKLFQKNLPQIPWKEIEIVDVRGLVDLLMNAYGKQCVDVIAEVLLDMNRMSLLRMLDTGYASRVPLSVISQWPELTNKVKTIQSVTELLLKRLADLSYEDLQMFKKILAESHRGLYLGMSWEMTIDMMNLQDLMFLIVLTFGQKSVEKVMEVLERMKKTDLLKMGFSLKPEELNFLDRHVYALNQKVALMAAVKELLVETLNGLSDKELETFKKFVSPKAFHSFIPLSEMLDTTHNTEVISDLMVDKLGLQSVEVTRESLLDMNRTDLVQKFPETSSASRIPCSDGQSVDGHEAAQQKKVSTVKDMKEILLKIFKDLGENELQKFHWLLQFTCFQKSFPQLPQNWHLHRCVHLVADMVQVLGLQCLEMTREVFMDMNRTDLVDKLSEISSPPEDDHPKSGPIQEQHSRDEQLSAPTQRAATITPDNERLFKVMGDLNEEELKEFKWHLSHSVIDAEHLSITASGLEEVDTSGLLDLMLQTYNQQCVEVTKEVFTRMKRSDLVQKL